LITLFKVINFSMMILQR